MFVGFFVLFCFVFLLRIFPKLSLSLSLTSVLFRVVTWAVIPAAVQIIHCDCLYQWISALLYAKQKSNEPTSQHHSSALQLAYSSFWKSCLSEMDWIIPVGRLDCAWRWKLQRNGGDHHSFSDHRGTPSYFLPRVALIHTWAFQQPHASKKFHSLTVWRDGKCGVHGCLLRWQCCWKLVHPLIHPQKMQKGWS